MTHAELAKLRLKAREWQTEADTAQFRMRAVYQRMADACARLADDLERQSQRDESSQTEIADRFSVLFK